jgi:hypothetical protein
MSFNLQGRSSRLFSYLNPLVALGHACSSSRAERITPGREASIAVPAAGGTV